MDNSVSEGYFVLIKSFISAGDMIDARMLTISLGYRILTDNEIVFFCKHNNPLLPVAKVSEDYKTVFRIKPLIYENLIDFFVNNDL